MPAPAATARGLTERSAALNAYLDWPKVGQILPRTYHVEVPQAAAPRVVAARGRTTIRGRQVNAEIARPR